MVTSNLKIERELRQDGVVALALGGKLDETFRADIFRVDEAKQLVLDLSHVDHVSSYGVREWVRALGAVRAKLDGLFFVEASPRMTDQFNMVSAFDGGGTLLSFLGIYVCADCSAETPSIFDVQLDRAAFAALEAPTRQCRRCGRDAALDDDPSVLFEYVRSTQFVAPNAQVMAVLRHPDSWIHQTPGVRLTTRLIPDFGGAGFQLVGIIDDTLPARRIVETEGNEIVLALEHVRHFDLNGAERWRKMIFDCAAKCSISLVDIPPVLIRRFADDPSLLGPARAVSACLPTICTKCRLLTWRRVRLDSIDACLSKPPPCQACGSSQDDGDTHALTEGLLTAVREARLRGNVAPPAPSTPAPTPVEKQPRARPADSGGAELLAEKYEILCKLAEGGMAEVFLVRQRGAMGFRQMAVIKKVRTELVTDDRMIRLFLEEAKAAARIDSPNVIRVLDLGRDKGDLYMVLEFVHGRSVAQAMRLLVAAKKVAAPALAAAVVADLCKGLSRAHRPDSQGKTLVHRDVTPANVLVSFDGVVKLVDFGLAGYARMRHADDILLGNPSYMAPESFMRHDPTPQTDIWAAGVVLLAMLTGKNPFRRSTTDATARAILRESIPKRWSRPWIPGRLFSVLKRSLQKDPALRYADAGTMADELTAASMKLGGANVAQWLKNLFADEISVENEFAKKCNAPSFTDALLTAEPAQIGEFYRVLRSRGTTRGP